MSVDRKVNYGFTPVGEALNDLPRDLGEWLDSNHILTFEVSKFIIGKLIHGDTVWTAEKVEFEYAKRYSEGYRDRELSLSVKSCLDGLTKMKLLKTPRGFNLKKSSRNARFRMKKDGAYFAWAHLYMVELAEKAGVRPHVVQGILWDAKYYLEYT